jgi:hypothetical protein
MGLYLAVFDEFDEELEGVEVGSYDDFSTFRRAVMEHLESGKPGSRFPTLILHSDCDGAWSCEDCEALEKELEAVRSGFRKLKPIVLKDWRAGTVKEVGINPRNLAECFFDIDGELLLDRLMGLVEAARKSGRSISFQ